MRKRRPLTLLEVLIAMAMVVLCALPLISPHVAMYKEQKKMIQKIELDRRVQNWFAQYYEDLLLGKAVLPEEPQQAFSGATYQIEEVAKKGKKPSAHLYDLIVTVGKQRYNYKLAVKYEEEKTDSHSN